MNTPQASLQTIHNLLRQQPFGVLATAGGDGAPYASLVAFAASQDDRQLYFITPRATRKFSDIVENPRVALLVTNSTNRLEDVELASTLTAVGRAAPVEPSHLDAVRDHSCPGTRI